MKRVAATRIAATRRVEQNDGVERARAGRNGGLGARLPSASLRWMTVAGIAAQLACQTTSPPVQTSSPTSPPPPEWVERGGRSSRHPEADYLTGFAAERGASALLRARQQAAADLAARVSLRIEHELRDVSEERDGRYRYEVAAITRTRSDLRLAGVVYETWSPERDGDDRVYALAILSRDRAVAQRRALLDGAISELRACLAAAERRQQSGASAETIALYEDCRRALALGGEHLAVLEAIRRPRSESDPQARALQTELAEAARRIDERVAGLLRAPAVELDDAVERLALELARQGVPDGASVTVAPFTYGTLDLSSRFGRRVAERLEGALVQRSPSGSQTPAPVHLAVRGVYLEQADTVRLSVTVKEVTTSRTRAYAQTDLLRRGIPLALELRPQNFAAALRDQQILSDGAFAKGERGAGAFAKGERGVGVFADGEPGAGALAGGELEVSEVGASDLRVELWTDKGRRGLLYQDEEELALYVRVNRPCWVRLIYVLPGGEQVPLEHAWRIDGERVNRVLAYPGIFEVVPPFGVEHIYVTAFTEEPPPLVTRTRVIAGERYEIVSDGMQSLVRVRGLRRSRQQQLAEAFVTVTTTAAD